MRFKIMIMRNPPTSDILSIGNSHLLNIQSLKILGFHIQQDLKWGTLISEVFKNCDNKLYIKMVKQH